ncbi:MAG: GH1 family beta-glucosidase [Actinomycetota bacterium]
MTGPTRRFPAGFVWGTATSAFQIEGAADVDGKTPSIWDTFCAEPGRIKDGSNGDIACDHYHRFGDDIDLMTDLGLQAYRFSMAWTRVVDERTGEVNHAGLDFYERLVDRLLAADIRPYPTLYHWDLPQALADRGGWLNRDTAHRFADYAEAVVERLGDRIPTWTTLNEPFVSANHGYATGEHAPGHSSMAEGLTAAHHLLLAHGLATERMRSMTKADMAIVINFTRLRAATDSAEDQELLLHRHNLENRWFVDPLDGKGYPQESVEHFEWDQREVRDGDLELIAQPIDLLGINFYSRSTVTTDDDYELPPGTRRNTMGWEIHPPSFGHILRWLRDDYSFERYLITENGSPMPDTVREGGRIVDDDRIAYIRDHLLELHTAIEDGCPVEGYLVWSFLDNFEWAHGYGPTFGIVEVDYDTLARTPKKSAEWFAGVARANGITLDTEEQHDG